MSENARQSAEEGQGAQPVEPVDAVAAEDVNAILGGNRLVEQRPAFRDGDFTRHIDIVVADEFGADACRGVGRQLQGLGDA